MRRRRSWRVVGRAGTPTSYACASRCDDLRVAAMISGHVAAGFEPVRHGFARLVGRREGGGALTVKLRGEIVVDLWTGYADGAQTRRWAPDTLAISFSTTKGVASAIAHRLADRGQLRYDE